ncbi:MAG: ABC transporter permease [Bacteroidales bacterium]|nr:ABC transporter permease [Candidatus Liminaster caballi]
MLNLLKIANISPTIAHKLRKNAYLCSVNKWIPTLGRYMILMGRVFAKPDSWSMFGRQFVFETQKLVIDSIGIVCLISVFIGALCALQIVLNMGDAILPPYIIGYTTRELLMLEFSSAIISLILAGKVGSNIASEIGTMRITEQIDALDIMGVNSANYIILPKIAAMVVFMPILVIFSISSGLVGAYLLAVVTNDPTPESFVTGIQTFFEEGHIYFSIKKGLFFAFLISSIASYCGYNVRGGALQVGKASTQAVVATSIFILMFDVILTEILM